MSSSSSSSLGADDESPRRYAFAGQELQIHEDVRRAVWRNSFGLTTWNSSIIMSAWFEAHPELVRKKRILELGSGTGLLGCVLALLGATVVVSDFQEDVLALLRRNVAANELDGSIKVIKLDWDFPDPFLEDLALPFDMIVGADLIYHDTERAFDGLLHVIRSYAPTSSTAVYLGYEPRSVGDQGFFEKAGVYHTVEKLDTSQQARSVVYKGALGEKQRVEVYVLHPRAAAAGDAHGKRTRCRI
jgi:predicted nicotinamide N-methyase